MHQMAGAADGALFGVAVVGYPVACRCAAGFAMLNGYAHQAGRCLDAVEQHMEMFDQWWPCEKRPDDAAPLRKRLRLPKAHRVVFQGVPLDLQHIAIRGFDGLVHRCGPKPVGPRDDGAQAAGDGFVKCGVLAVWMRMSAISKIMAGFPVNLEQDGNGP